jgi:hypothetical protein
MLIPSLKVYERSINEIVIKIDLLKSPHMQHFALFFLFALQIRINIQYFRKPPATRLFTSILGYVQ